MNYIVLDFEWNQPPSARRVERVPFEFHSELMQIGAIKLNRKFKIKGKYKAYIKPTFYPRIHSYVKRITGITEKDLREGDYFPYAYKKFSKFCGRRFCFLTWGPDDIPVLADNLLAHGLSTKKIPASYDLQKIFNKQKRDTNTQISLADACDLLGIERNLPQHDAYADAYHTYLICEKLEMKKGIKEYEGEIKPKRNYEHPEKKKKNNLYSNTLYTYSEGPFEDYDSLYEYMKKTGFKCPICKEYRESKELITVSHGRKETEIECSEHGKYIVRTFVNSKADGIYYGVRLFEYSGNDLKHYYKISKKEIKNDKKAQG